MMKLRNILLVLISVLFFSCSNTEIEKRNAVAAEILGNPEYRAMSFGGYRQNTRDIVPSVAELKEDLKIMHALGIKVLRTYNTQQFLETANLLKAIRELKEEDSSFEMYVMLGAWIACEESFTDKVNHEKEDLELNKNEINAAISFAKEYPDIVKVIAVGNEAMVHWAATYFVSPKVILKYVSYLQGLKFEGELSKDLWITSSDNFASWGGESAAYHNEDLNKLIKAVDYVSMHTYPFHDTHYNSAYWQMDSIDSTIDKIDVVKIQIEKARDYAIKQYSSTKAYIHSIDSTKAVHIGETGWASASNSFYGTPGSAAADEYKEKLYHDLMREWTDKNNISCFYFEMFNEPWKDGNNALGSENHFGLITADYKAKYALWEEVDKGTFKGLTRGGKEIAKTYNGDEGALLEEVYLPE